MEAASSLDECERRRAGTPPVDRISLVAAWPLDAEIWSARPGSATASASEAVSKLFVRVARNRCRPAAGCPDPRPVTCFSSRIRYNSSECYISTSWLAASPLPSRCNRKTRGYFNNRVVQCIKKLALIRCIFLKQYIYFIYLLK